MENLYSLPFTLYSSAIAELNAHHVRLQITCSRSWRCACVRLSWVRSRSAHRNNRANRMQSQACLNYVEVQPMEVMVVKRKTALDVVKIKCAHLLLLLVQAHDGIVEQGELPPHAIVALWRWKLNKLRGDINHVNLETLTWGDAINQVTSPRYHAVTGIHCVAVVIERETTLAIITICVHQIGRQRFLIDTLQWIPDYNMFTYNAYKRSKMLYYRWFT